MSTTETDKLKATHRTTELLSQSPSGKWYEVLKGGLGGCGSNSVRVLHSAVLLEGLYELGDSRTLLTDGDVDPVQLFLAPQHPSPDLPLSIHSL